VAGSVCFFDEEKKNQVCGSRRFWTFILSRARDLGKDSAGTEWRALAGIQVIVAVFFIAISISNLQNVNQ
jgi:hypothetical protein